MDSEPFSVENGLTTPTFKHKRPQLLQHYKAEIDRCVHISQISPVGSITYQTAVTRVLSDEKLLMRNEWGACRGTACDQYRVD